MASTSEIYGDATEPPDAESDEASPKTNYAVAKLADERFVQTYSTEYDLDYTIVRYFNVYGPRQDPSGYGYVVRRACRLSGRKRDRRGNRSPAAVRGRPTVCERVESEPPARIRPPVFDRTGDRNPR